MSATILIVDDEAHLRMLIQQTLEELEDEGVKAFADSFKSLLDGVEERRKNAVASIQPLADSVSKRIACAYLRATRKLQPRLRPSLHRLLPNSP